jgi:hypothetical protein
MSDYRHHRLTNGIDENAPAFFHAKSKGQKMGLMLLRRHI